jgi:phosphoenolpyruvate-protein kinase (PTS system EI component)
VVCVAILFAIPSLAQTPDRRQAKSPPQALEQPSSLPQNANSTDAVANEIALLRKSLQTLNARLLEITNKALASDGNQSGSANDKQNRISQNLALLTQAEQRAEYLRKQLLELIEKEALYKSRLVQIEEDMRPESIERALNPYGTTRTAEMRDTRRRVLENDRRGYESLLNLTTQSRIRLEDDVKQADFLVSKLRQRVLPLIDKEIEKIIPN